MHSTKEFKEYFQCNEKTYDSINHSWFDIKSDKGGREREGVRERECVCFTELGSHILSSSFRRKKITVFNLCML